MSTVINQVVTLDKVFPVGNKHPFVEHIIEVFGYPGNLVGPR